MAASVDEGILAIINNIPSNYHSSDLRNFFSEFIETESFMCFHFRHRPEVKEVKNAEDSQVTDDKKPRLNNSTCCVVKVKSARFNDFLDSYNKQNWLDKEGFTLPLKCFIKRIKVQNDVQIGTKRYIPRGRTKVIPADREVFTQDDLNKLIEMHPPIAMPNGNVGTPTKIFLDLIRQCRLPSAVIGKLGLEFPRSRAKRKYSSVPLNYGPNRQRNQRTGGDKPMVRTLWGHVITDQHTERVEPEEIEEESDEEIVESGSDDDNDTCEEWERHESLHDDVTSQGRTKERLFEEEIELKWEKGGSGLVFYTDAQYWDEQDGDFDEKTADDLDVDMSIYYEPGAGDKDAKDMRSMRREERLRNGNSSTSLFDDNFERDNGKIGSFECHTKGFGKKLMKKQGWKEGEGLGKTILGRPEPILDIGQKPWDKKGFGYVVFHDSQAW